MGLGAVDLWVWEKKTEFWDGSLDGSEKEVVESWGRVLLTYGSDKEIQTLNSGWVSGLQ